MNRHLIAALDAWREAAPDLKPTLAAINRPGTGTLAEANKAIVKVGDAIVTTQLQERAITPHTLAAVDSLATIAPHANALMDSAAKTADAGAETLHSASATLQTINSGTGPLLAAYTQSGNDLDALLKSHAVNDTLANVDAFTGSAAGIAGNMDKISAHLEQTVDKPQPLWKALVPGAELGAKLWACAFEHV